MERTCDLDRLRAWIDGRLDATERARLERDLAADAELAELAERLRDVYALTAVEDQPPPCRVTFSDLERRLAPSAPSWPRRAAAAALILGAGAAGWWALDGLAGGPAPEPTASASSVPVAPAGPTLVRLETLSATFEPSPVELEPAWVPEVLANFDPRGAEGIAWLHDQRSATFIASAARRPLLVLGSMPGCPWCATLRSEVFANPSVAGLADLFVPLEWDLSELPEKELAWIQQNRGYPLLEIWNSYDDVVLNFSGRPDAALFEEMLHQGLERAGAVEAAPAWEDLRDWAQRWLAADRARTQGRMAEAVAGWRELSRRAQGNVLAKQATLALGEVEAEANAALASANELAPRDAAAAREVLLRARARFADTDAERDLAAVLAAFESTGRFPTLESVPASR